MKIIHSNPQLRHWLRRERHTTAHASTPQFSFNDELFAQAAAQVHAQHPSMTVPQIEDRAALLLLREGHPGQEPFREMKEHVHRKLTDHRVWKILWAIAVIVLLLFLAVKGHAQGNAGGSNARLWWWNGTSWVAVSAGDPLPVTGGGGGGGGTSSNFGAAFPSAGTAIGVKNGTNMVNLNADGSGNLFVNCSNCSGSGASAADEATFTPGTTSFAPAGCFFQTTTTNNALTNLQGGWLQCTANRELYTAFRTTPTVNAAQSGTWTVQPGNTANTTAWLVTGTGGTFPVTGTFWQATQPVSGTFWQATQPVSIADAADVTLGAKADAKSTATDTTAVTIMQVLKEISAMEQAPASRAVTNAGTFAVQAAQSGTWTVQPGNTANTTPWLFDLNKWGGTSLGTPTNFGTTPGAVIAGSVNSSCFLLTVACSTGNGTVGTGVQRVAIASDNTAFNVNATLSAETTKVIGTVRNVGNVGGVFDAIGQNVTFPANWLATGCEFTTSPTTLTTGKGSPLSCDTANNLFVNVATSVLPTGAATSTKQSDGSQKTQIVDGGGNVISSTSNNLNVQCANCSGSGASAVDEAAFTGGSSVFAPSGCFFQTTATSNALTTGQQGMSQCTANRALFSNLRDASGTELGTATTPLQVSLANTGSNATPIKTDQSSQAGTSITTTPVAFGSGTPSGNAPGVNAAQFIGTAAQINDGTAGVAAVGGHFGDNGDAAATDRVPILPAIAESNMPSAATAGRNAALRTDLQENLLTAQVPETSIASYKASKLGLAVAASATDIAVLPGNASNTVIVTGVRVSCTQTTAGQVQLQLIQRTTADTAGTSAAMTVINNDTNNGSGVSAPLNYTANPTINSTVGNYDSVWLGCMAAGTATPNDIYIWRPGMGQSITLRGTAQQLAVNLNATTVSGGNFDITFEWMETTGL